MDLHKIINEFPEVKNCPVSYILAVNDTLNVISGKWKFPIIASLLYGNKKFGEIQNFIPKITPRMLSKELKELELNNVVIKKMAKDKPTITHYQLSESGKKITEVMDAMVKWGLEHREKTVMN